MALFFVNEKRASPNKKKKEKLEAYSKGYKTTISCELRHYARNNWKFSKISRRPQIKLCKSICNLVSLAKNMLHLITRQISNATGDFEKPTSKDDFFYTPSK